MAQPLRSLPPQIKNAPLVVPTRRVKFVRVEVIKASLLIRTTTVHYIIGVGWTYGRALAVISRLPAFPAPRPIYGSPGAHRCCPHNKKMAPPVPPPIQPDSQ